MDIVKDLTKFEPETDPMPANGKVGIGYSMPSVVHGNVGIESVKHWVLSLPSYQFGICTKRFCTRYQTYLWICVGISTQCQPSHQIVTSSVSISHRISHAYMIFCHFRILFDVKKKPYFTVSLLLYLKFWWDWWPTTSNIRGNIICWDGFCHNFI
jgi:hypothetical protein